MKKSEMYAAAQTAVLLHEGMNTRQKLDIIRLLMEDEKIAIFAEKKEKEEEKNAEKASN